METTQQRIARACRLIEQSLDRTWPLEELARAADFSPFHFHRLFQATVGETAHAYARRLRLERAAQRLEQDSSDILAVALDAGYSSHEAFTRAFQRTFGVPPSEYRSGAAQARNEVPRIELRIEQRPACCVAAVRHVGPYDQVGTAWKALMKWGWSKLLFGAKETFGLCYDDPDVTDAARLRYEACMVVGDKARTRGDVRLLRLPAATFAIALHVGPYEDIGASFSALYATLIEEYSDRYRIADPPAREIYLNDPRKTPPAQRRTEIWLPVERI